MNWSLVCALLQGMIAQSCAFLGKILGDLVSLTRRVERFSGK